MKKSMIFISLLLILTSLVLAACATPEEELVDSGEKTIYVGPDLVACEGVAPQQCMQVKEDPDAEYTLYYYPIEGFDYEEGYEYELLIREENVENPPADGSSLKWILVEEVSKTPVESTAAETPETGAEAVETEETLVPAEGGTMTVYIGPEIVDCVGVAPQTCLQVKVDPAHDYNLFYDQIEGFEFEPGYEYELLVQVEPVENAPADASTLKYTLVEEVSKTPVSTASSAETDQTAAEETKLENTTWSLRSFVTPDGQAHDVLLDTRVTALFDGEQVSGSAGCNQYFGAYELDGSSLTIGVLGSTMMACSPEEIMTQETAYLATLSAVASFEITGDQLQLKDAAGQTVLLYAVEEALSLSSVSWNLISFNNGQEAMVSVIIDTEITAQFGEDGTLSGAAGCNRYTGTYEAVDNSIAIGPLAHTEMFCGSPEGVMEQEMQYLTALENAAVYQIDGTRLEIRDANGAGVATYEAAQPSTLTGKTWNLLFYNNGRGALVSTIIDTQITALFDEEGNMSGSAGCNNYTAAYESDGEQISIGMAAATQMFCAEPEDIMEQEAQYLAALQNAAVYLIEGNRLEIRDADGAGVASYEALEEGASAADGETGVSAAESGAVDAAAETVAPSEVPTEIVDALANASYPLNYTGTGTIQLTDGEYREPAAEDSAAEIITQMTEYIAVGELADGQPLVAVILTTQTGGTGTFYDLVVMTEEDGQFRNPAATYLGDRIIINKLSFEGSQIVTDLVVQGPEDPFCCPTQQVIQTYELINGGLTQVGSEVIGTVEAQSETAPEIANIIWKWQELNTPVEQITIDSPEKYTVEFKEDGIVDVVADCNRGSGIYSIDGKSISINITATTLALCEEGSQGDLLFSSLGSAAIYFMDGEDLMIDMVADGGTMRFFE